MWLLMLLLLLLLLVLSMLLISNTLEIVLFEENLFIILVWTHSWCHDTYNYIM